MKKAELTSTVFNYIFVVIIAAIVVIIFIYSRQRLSESQNTAGSIIVDEKIKAASESLLYGDVGKISLNVPVNSKVCFIDSRREKRDFIYERNYGITSKYAIIKDLLDPSFDTDKNIVYIDKVEDKVVKSSFAPEICYNEEPYFECVESIGTKLELWLEGRGRCTSIRSYWDHIATDNRMNKSKYNKSIMFSARDKEINWYEISTNRI